MAGLFINSLVSFVVLCCCLSLLASNVLSIIIRACQPSIQVRGDMSTDVMKRSIARKYLQQDQSHASQSHSQLHSATTSSGSQSSAHTAQVISLLLKDRTLDFEVNEVRNRVGRRENGTSLWCECE